MNSKLKGCILTTALLVSQFSYYSGISQAYVQTEGVLVSQLPSPSVGLYRTLEVTDSSLNCISGQTVTGGGSGKCLVHSDGVAWFYVTIGAIPGSIAGTANQINASNPTGNVILSLANNVVVNTSIGTGTPPNPTWSTGGGFASTEGAAPTGQSSTDEIYANSTLHNWVMINNANTAPQQIVGDSTGLVEFTIEGGGAIGNNTTYPANTQLAASVAVTNCHFANLTCVTTTLMGAACNTAPLVNIYNINSTSEGTAVVCSNVVQGTLGTVTTQSESLAITTGSVYGMFVNAVGNTCTVANFKVTAEVTCP